MISIKFLKDTHKIQIKLFDLQIQIFKQIFHFLFNLISIMTEKLLIVNLILKK